MLRQEHLLTKLVKRSAPSRVVFVDTESRLHPPENSKQLHTFRLGVAKYCRTRGDKVLHPENETKFTKTTEFWNWLLPQCRKNETVYVVSHNLSYDLPILKTWSHTFKANYRITSHYSKGMVTIISLEKYFPTTKEHHKWLRGDREHGKKPPVSRITFVDNTNLHPGKLAEWGERVDLPKLEVDFYGKDKQLVIYCERDVDIMIALWRQWFAFLKDNKCPKFSLTVGSTAFNTYRAAFMNHDIYIHAEQRPLELERMAYKGGRTETLYRGKVIGEPVYVLDLNSMYPFVMAEHDYPTSIRGYYKDTTIKHLKRVLKTYSVVARVLIDTKEPKYQHKVNPFAAREHLSQFSDKTLPLEQRELKTAYPIGRFETTLTTPELIEALTHNEIVKVLEMATYNKANIFREYVEHFYNLRLYYKAQGDQLRDKLCKLLLNSLYGKFGQRGYEEQLVGYALPNEYSTFVIYNYGKNSKKEIIRVGGSELMRTQKPEHYNSFPAIAAHVTGFARMLLWRLIKVAGLDNTFYMDTDSLFVNQQGLNNLSDEIDPLRLGALKLEHTSHFSKFYAAKDYTLQTKSAHKGVKANAIKIAHNVYQQERWPKLKGLWRSDDPERYEVETFTKTLHRHVYSGVTLPSGRVVPFQLQDF